MFVAAWVQPNAALRIELANFGDDVGWCVEIVVAHLVPSAPVPCMAHAVRPVLQSRRLGVGTYLAPARDCICPILGQQARVMPEWIMQGVLAFA
jgi:hypothetical protein